MATIVRIKKVNDDNDNFFDVGNPNILSEMFGVEFGIDDSFRLGEHKYTIKNIGVSGFAEKADMWDTIDGEYERNTTLYFYCETIDPRWDAFEHNLQSLKEDVFYYSK